jgi:peptidoglycan/LPS O-acetylase OafA/YrhL
MLGFLLGLAGGLIAGGLIGVLLLPMILLVLPRQQSAGQAFRLWMIAFLAGAAQAFAAGGVAFGIDRFFRGDPGFFFLVILGLSILWNDFKRLSRSTDAQIPVGRGYLWGDMLGLVLTGVVWL